MEREVISVRLLGGFSVQHGARTLGTLPPQAVSLLAYLLMNRDRPQTRDLLAGKFWSELPEDRARKRLSNTLWQIKTAAVETGLPELLEPASSEVKVTTAWPIVVDAEQFEAELADFELEMGSPHVNSVLADRLADVLSRYPGDFLAGHYADWIDFDRDRIRDRYHAALGQLVQLYKARSQYDLALRFASTLVKQEPLREDLHREVMRIQALLGQTAAAERQFELCRAELEKELGVEPSSETVELLERIRTDAPAAAVEPALGASTSTALIGRSHEIGVLTRRGDELLGGEGGVVLIEGDPGIGKSRLMEEFVDGAHWRGAKVLTGGHTELSPLRPYETLRTALAPAMTGLRGEHLAEVIEPVWLQQAAEVFPDLDRFVGDHEPSQRLRPSEEPTRMSEALVRVILAQGALAPTVIVLEDIHWADDDSMQVLVQLGHRLARSGVLLCLTYRRFEAEQSASVWKGILDLEALPSGTRLVLAPLNGAQVRDLVHAQIGPGGLTSAQMRQLVEETGGNPLYVLEALRDPGALHDSAAGGSLRSLHLPDTVARSLEARLEQFGGPVRHVLEGLAALAEPAAAQTVAQIAGLGRRQTIVALDEAVGAGFVIDDEAGICRFAHDQTRRVVYELVSDDDRRAIHDRIFQALEGEDEPKPEQLAYHARLAGRLADTHHWHLVAAGEALAVNGYRVAADHFAQADEAAQDLGRSLADRAGDLLAYEAALDVLGRREEQTMVLKLLNEVDLPVEQALQLAEREAWLLLNTDKPDEAARLALDAVERAAQTGRSGAELLTIVGTARYQSGDWRSAIEPLSAAMETADAPAAKIMAETTLGKAHVDLMEYEIGIEHLRSAVAAAEEIDDVRAEVEASGFLAVASHLSGHHAEAEAIFSQAIDLSRAIGYRRGEGNNLVNLASFHINRGSGGQALELFTQASDVFGSVKNDRGEAFVKLNSATLHHLLLGDDVTANDLSTSAAVFFRSVEDHPRECLALALVSSIDLRAGRRRLARRRLNDLLDRAIDDGDAFGEIAVRRVLARLELELGRAEETERQLDRVLELGTGSSIEVVLPNVLARRAQAACERGHLERAEQFVDRAVELNRPGADLAHLTAWLASGVYGAIGREDESIGQIERAYRLVEDSLVGLPCELIIRSWESVPEHGRIAEQYERRFVRTLPVRLPALDAPSGRPLRPDEFVDVTWTISEPGDWDAPTHLARRQRRITRLAAQAIDQGALTRVADLADALIVSERTVKRDLAELRHVGRGPRTRKSV